MDSSERQSRTPRVKLPPRERIFLNVLSPSSEVSQKLTFPEIPLSTTIRELKEKIQNDVATKPSPERQRLIYRGRALTQDEKTLEDIFGPEAVQNADVFSLHLVLPPVPNQASSSGLYTHPQQTETPSRLPERPIGLPPLPGPHIHVPPRPASTGQLPPGIGMRPMFPQVIQGGVGTMPQQNPMPWLGMQFPQGQMPPPMQELLNAHFAALGQPPNGQPGTAAFSPNQGIPHVHNQGGVLQQAATLPQFPAFPQFLPPQQPNFQQVLAQQQQARAAAGLQGLGSINTNQTSTQAGPSAARDDVNSAPNRVATPGTSSTTVREGQHANGSHWRVVINQSTTTLTPSDQHGQSHLTHPSLPNAGTQTATAPLMQANATQASVASQMSSERQSVDPSQGRESYWPNSPIAILQQRLSQLEGSLDNGNPPALNDLWQTRNQLQNIRNQQPDLPAGAEIPLNTRLVNISLRAAQMRNQLASNAGQAASSLNTGLPPADPPTSTMVYLLSSPSGPYALLIGPSGMYGTAPGGAGMINPLISASMMQGGSMTSNQEAQPTPTQNLQPQPEGQAAQGVQPQQQQPPDQVGELMRILLPLGGHLWLLIRMFGFIFFFTSGAGWSRTMLLCMCAILVFVGQTGVFRPLQQAVWEPLRRHMEGLVPLGGNNNDVPANNPIVPANREAQASEVPTPQQVAERLLRERDEQDQGFVRRNVRRVERAMALFIASLVPGVGERHIAARDAAEAARQAAAQREREEQARREEEARQQVEGNDGSADGENAFADAEEGSTPRPANVDQQPLALLNEGHWLDAPHDSGTSSSTSFQNWQPPGCMLHRYNGKDISACFQSRRVVLVGDSTIRQIYWAIAKKLDLSSGNENSIEGREHSDLQMNENNVALQFVWDPFLNSTRLYDELTSYQGATTANLGGQRAEGPSIIVAGGGLWHVRHIEVDALEQYRTAVRHIASYMQVRAHQGALGTKQIRPATMATDQDILLLTPVQVPAYEDLSPDRAATILSAKVDTMNDDLLEMSSNGTADVIWSYHAMTQLNHTHRADGLHLVARVAAMQADVLLNLRCNAKAASRGRYPFNRTCCSRYSHQNWIQRFTLFCGTLVLPITATVMGRESKRLPLLPYSRIIQALSVLGLALCYCFYADRTQIFNKAHKQYDSREFAALCWIIFWLGLLSIRRSSSAPTSKGTTTILQRDEPFLSRDQTDEWKGWMQFIVLVYHYTGASKILWIYELIRLLVASYLFMTGFGHTVYFYTKDDYSFRRFAAVVVRLNLLSCILPYIMRTDYLFYYFAPLVSFWFVVIYMTMGVRRSWNASLPLLLSKITVSAIAVTALIRVPGLLEQIFSVLKYTCKIEWNVTEWRFRVALDMYIIYFGMLAGVLYVKTNEALRGRSNDTTSVFLERNFQSLHKAAFACSIGMIFVYGTIILSFQDKYSYNAWHPYISPFAVLAYTLLRNTNGPLRNYHSSIFAWLGRCSLETFTLQFHIWLAADTKGLLSIELLREVVPGGRWIDFGVLTILFLWVSWHVAAATSTLTSWIIDLKVWLAVLIAVMWLCNWVYV
ncbi:hypothetical protein MMC13_004228 [Lambiella insularis]|nr:hypothetical protein [Lambiella insularis]